MHLILGISCQGKIMIGIVFVSVVGHRKLTSCFVTQLALITAAVFPLITVVFSVIWFTVLGHVFTRGIVQPVWDNNPKTKHMLLEQCIRPCKKIWKLLCTHNYARFNGYFNPLIFFLGRKSFVYIVKVSTFNLAVPIPGLLVLPNFYYSSLSPFFLTSTIIKITWTYSEN